MERCPNCGGELKIIAAFEEPTVIVRILSHLAMGEPLHQPWTTASTEARPSCDHSAESHT